MRLHVVELLDMPIINITPRVIRAWH